MYSTAPGMRAQGASFFFCNEDVFVFIAKIKRRPEYHCRNKKTPAMKLDEFCSDEAYHLDAQFLRF